jgi:NitT/TauT family transport system permease protein
MAKELTATLPAAPRASLRRGQFRPYLLRVASVLALLAVWATLAALPWAIPVPSPAAVLQAALSLDPKTFATDLALSFYRVAAGFLVAAAIGIPVGIWIGYSRFARNLLFPIIEVLRPIPPIAWIPLAILFFPTAEWMIVFLTFTGALFPITYNTIAGFGDIKPMYIRAGRSLGADNWRLFWHVIFPAMLPVIFAGLRVAVGTAWLMVVAGEMMANKGGIGAMTWEAYQTVRYPRIFVGMAAIGFLGFASSALVEAIGRRITRWAEH